VFIRGVISDLSKAARYTDPDEEQRQQCQQENQPPVLPMHGRHGPEGVVGMDGESEIQVVWACSHG
jgi:hypothetical protein